MKTHPHTHLVAATAYVVDRSVRADLSDNKVANEPDYVSNLTAGIRKFWDFHQLPNFSHSQTLAQSQENVFGCDAIVVLRLENRAKICLFEAKWPRLSTPRATWDSIQKSSTVSHFTDQLRRQSKWVEQAAIWELFIHEWPPGERRRGFDEWGSTCFWHETTYLFDRANRDPSQVWKDSDLIELADFVRGGDRNLMRMLLRAAQCQQGDYLPIQNGHVTLSSNDAAESVEVPASLAVGDDAMIAFREEFNFEHFLYLSLTRE